MSMKKPEEEDELEIASEESRTLDLRFTNVLLSVTKWLITFEMISLCP